MADNKKMVEAITSMDVDFAQWYTDVVKKGRISGLHQRKGMYGYQARRLRNLGADSETARR